MESKKQTGFTLIELLVAIFVLLVGILAIVIMFPLGLKIMKASEMETQANYLDQQKMEDVNTLSYDEILIGTSLENSFPSPFTPFQRQTRITYVDPSQNLQETATDKGIKKIEVSVSWISPFGGGQKTVSADTLISQK